MDICPICQDKRTIFFHQIEKYRYYQCNNCITLFLNPIPSQKNIDSFYSNDFDYSAGLSNEHKIRKRANNIWNNLRKLNPKGKTILDIGSGYGYFIDEIRKQGGEVLGLEPSKELYRYSTKKLDLTVERTTIEYFRRKNKKFDFITLIHVIEHIPKPQMLIKSALEMLNDSGILFIETPNLDSHLFYAEKENYTFLTPPDHLYIFSLKSLFKMIEKISQVKIVDASTYSYPDHFMGILKSLIKKKAQMTIKNNSAKNHILKNKRIVTTLTQKLKIILLDKILANIFVYPLNRFNKGSILEIYLKKN